MPCLLPIMSALSTLTLWSPNSHSHPLISIVSALSALSLSLSLPGGVYETRQVKQCNCMEQFHMWTNDSKIVCQDCLKIVWMPPWIVRPRKLWLAMQREWAWNAISEPSLPLWTIEGGCSFLWGVGWGSLHRLRSRSCINLKTELVGWRPSSQTDVQNCGTCAAHLGLLHKNIYIYI